jgi:hypothetical protein
LRFAPRLSELLRSRLRRLQNDLRAKDRQLDTAAKEATALKSQVAAKERCVGGQRRATEGDASATRLAKLHRWKEPDCATNFRTPVTCVLRMADVCRFVWVVAVAGLRPPRGVPTPCRLMQQHTAEIGRLKDRVLKAEGWVVGDGNKRQGSALRPMKPWRRPLCGPVTGGRRATGRAADASLCPAKAAGNNPVIV